ncbi:hypothetical protein WI99_35465 [Burkholderia cepacia]|nr:hypothetical protein WI99_35465 [Burkholderia cepacia]
MSQFLIWLWDVAHQLGPRLDFQKWLVVVVQLFRASAAFLDEVLEIRTGKHFEVQHRKVRLRWYRTCLHWPLILTNMSEDVASIDFLRFL